MKGRLLNPKIRALYQEGKNCHLLGTYSVPTGFIHVLSNLLPVSQEEVERQSGEPNSSRHVNLAALGGSECT